MTAMIEHDTGYVDYACEFCGIAVPDFEPEYCCSGFECCCGGMPMEPCFCSDKCYEKHEAKEKLEAHVRYECAALSRISKKRIRKEFELEQALALASDELPDSFTQWPLFMTCGLSDVNVVKYKMEKDNGGGVWLFGDCPDFADHTYHGYTDRQQNGFAGRHITFDLSDGGSVTLKGPFKCRPPKHMDAKVMTRGVIGTSISRHPDLQDYFGNLTIYHGVLHLDRDWILGEFNRIENLAQEIANERNKEIWYRCESRGGSHSGAKQPHVRGNEGVC